MEQADKKTWLCCAYVAWAVNEFPGPADPDDLVVIFPDIISKYHKEGPIPSMQKIN